MTRQANTHNGQVTIESDIPLGQLKLGNTVLGRQNPDDLAEPRTTHVVTATLGKHFVPTEDPSRTEQFLVRIGLERVVSGGRVEGILVDGTYGPGLFALKDNPVLDRVRSR